MGYARVGSNPTVVDSIFCLLGINLHPCLPSCVPVAQWIAHQTSDLGVGGSSPPRDSFFSCSSVLSRDPTIDYKIVFAQQRCVWCKFGRVVKALALGASLERGMGSNPIACITKVDPFFC
jgi:hypothetical protein